MENEYLLQQESPASALIQSDTDLALLQHKINTHQKFTLAKLAVKPARAVITRKREYSFWHYKQIETLTQLIEKHYKTDKKVSFYSQELRTTPKTLNRLTSHVLGQTVYQLILDRRLKLSREMLQDPSKIIKEVAYQTGFKSPERFGRFFKEMTGISAREFRREALRQTNKI